MTYIKNIFNFYIPCTTVTDVVTINMEQHKSIVTDIINLQFRYNCLYKTLRTHSVHIVVYFNQLCMIC